MPGLLIVNADDLGLDTNSTDAILSCFRAGSITSATGMVWMQDSDRAAEMARDAQLPTGIHLNLIEPFTAPDVPVRVAATQRRVVERLRTRDVRAQLYHPGWSADFEQCIADQLTRFHELYGRSPTHADGHQHMHLALNALFARALGPVGKCRRPVNRLPGDSPAHKRAARAALAAVVRARFLTTYRCFSVRSLHPALGGVDLDQSLARSQHASVELMVHPGYPDELRLLSAPEWPARLGAHRLGTFEDLGL
ncbi:MAG: ChbG/HpnK family deacetylase [Solirubrobacterales bacterium]|nr:ChbG/HpnK family deacetylase [Solirubrobacterales bacterium]